LWAAVRQGSRFDSPTSDARACLDFPETFIACPLLSEILWITVSRRHVEPIAGVFVMPFVLALLLALVPVTAAGEDSLCHRLGGSDAISTVVQSFLKKMRKDDADKLGRFWLHRGTDGVAREEQLIVDFVQSATGCDRLYVGRSMVDAHRGMGLSAKDWDRTVDFLRATMTEFKVAPELQNEVVTLVGSTRSSMVECEADKFGCR
jgi:hemoglobin